MWDNIKQYWKLYLFLGILFTPFFLIFIGHKSMKFLWE